MAIRGFGEMLAIKLPLNASKTWLTLRLLAFSANYANKPEFVNILQYIE